jgi:carboxylate-amine ligase
MEFVSSSPGTIGMEMEFQLLDSESLDLVDGILPLMELYPDNPHIKPEFIQNTVEVCSRICTSVAELEAEMFALVRDLEESCRRLDMRLCSAGTHPFGQRLAIITPLPRYLRLEKTSGYLGHTQITFATHVHVGMRSGDEALAVMQDLKPFLPLLIAISANSPFWRGYETGYAAYRHRILAATRSYGIPPTFGSWAEFADFFDVTRRAGIFRTINDIHWDIRPRPHLGTLEIRVMDAQPSVARAVSLAGFVLALINYLRAVPASERPPEIPVSLHWWLEKHNHFQASQLGLETKYIQDEVGAVTELGELFARTTELLEPHAGDTHAGSFGRRMRACMEHGPGYITQRRVFEQYGTLLDVVRFLSEELVRELASVPGP